MKETNNCNFQYTKEDAFREINETQDYYVSKLKELILCPEYSYRKVINFQSDTGTGKTKMMAKLINQLPNTFFIVTSLSRGQLKDQIAYNLNIDCINNNYAVFGLMDYKVNSKLQAEDILSLVPNGSSFIWIRDEGHINTTKWEELLINKAQITINFTATSNETPDIQCNFSHTMMLRTVSQCIGTPEDAINKLLEIKKEHLKIQNYNPCALFRCVNNEQEIEDIISLCNKNNLKYINIIDENYDISELCEDDNQFDVIINKFKITEGIDIRRAHVLFMDNQPSNPQTTIQVIGRCRRNALLYRDDIDILQEKNKNLLKTTRQCFVFYNTEGMHIDEDENGNLCSAFSNAISVEKLKPNTTIFVSNGVLQNGLTLLELTNQTGIFTIEYDHESSFNYLTPKTDIYNKKTVDFDGDQLVITIKHNVSRHHHHLFCYDEVLNYSKNEVLEKIEPFHICDAKILGFSNLYDLRQTEDITISTYISDQLKKDFNDFLDQYVLNRKSYCFHRETIQKRKTKRIQYKLTYLSDISLSYDGLFCRYSWDSFYTYASTDDHSASDLVHLLYPNLDYCCNMTTIRYFDSIEEREKYIDSLSKDGPRTILQHLDKNVLEYHTTRYKIDKNMDSWSKKTTIYEYEMMLRYSSYTKVTNDFESALIGIDTLRLSKNNEWVEDKTISSKLNKPSKFKFFIERKYGKILETKNKECFTGKNTFGFSKKLNSMLGYCVEYYSKFAVYGPAYLGDCLLKACEEQKIVVDNYNTQTIVRACILKYKECMQQAFGIPISSVYSISITELEKPENQEFINTIVSLGNKVAEFVKLELNVTHQLQLGDILYDPNLSIEHISGLADYINENTIIDIKVTNSISIEHLKQVLAYHYLSTKRSDLHITRCIVFDAVSGKSITMNIL